MDWKSCSAVFARIKALISGLIERGDVSPVQYPPFI
jgi:hypothetical protein